MLARKPAHPQGLAPPLAPPLAPAPAPVHIDPQLVTSLDLDLNPNLSTDLVYLRVPDHQRRSPAFFGNIHRLSVS